MIRDLELAGGEVARVEAVRGDHVTLRCAAAAPPGSTLEARLAGDPEPVVIKVRGCRRQPGDPTSFRIEGRFLNLSRDRRRRLLDG